MNDALTLAQNYAAGARAVVQERLSASSLDAEQHIAHGYASIETGVDSLRAASCKTAISKGRKS